MTETTQTARFALPLLAMAQAQKEVTHNEALVLLDALVHAAIEDGPLEAPPPSPAVGQCWLVGAGAGGDWAGQADAVAIWCEGGWRFAAPRAGMRIVRLSDGVWLRYGSGAWAAPDALANPGGGTTIDAEARSAIAALIQLLEAQGLLISA
ncbi:hypothetical protein CVO77_07375 [Sphingopyxis lindanitolerans]|uniref:DUF2793 domain-containing protein n=1 Tax=Sphingopyxis lindanitolerans TaxID=2054227 RepID=A0A2S8B7S8_9SPHN|nr:DUF2793 domain-containing protein [Sphingopyxis lindanitolerans]PQM28309.1 hypothetical protein CVO77_07375 [Sphingopyxis lindanitolerans]